MPTADHDLNGKSPHPAVGEGITYRGYTIRYDPPPIPVRDMDWHFVHKDYEGGYYDAEGSVCEGDHRAGSAASEQACRDEIDMIEDDQ